jgi:hypothetical protein
MPGLVRRRRQRVAPGGRRQSGRPRRIRGFVSDPLGLGAGRGGRLARGGFSCRGAQNAPPQSQTHPRQLCASQ